MVLNYAQLRGFALIVTAAITAAHPKTLLIPGHSCGNCGMDAFQQADDEVQLGYSIPSSVLCVHTLTCCCRTRVRTGVC
jgi:hypothetical protein